MSQEQFVGGVPVPGDHVAVIANVFRSQFIPFNNDPLQQAVDPAAVANGTAPDTNGLIITKIIIQQALVTNVQGNPLPSRRGSRPPIGSPRPRVRCSSPSP